MAELKRGVLKERLKELEDRMPWFVYWLQDEASNKTYIGKTNDLNRRLRQHNGEISGGAYATHGSHWRRVCHVAGFPDERGALQFEWAWKYYSRKLPIKDSFKRRVEALHALLSADKVTSNADVLEGLEVVWEDDRSPL